MSDVSVVLATYNGAQFLRSQLASLAAQTSRPAELIVADDGSCDTTLDVVADFADRAPFPVHIFRNDSNLGYGENFLRASEKTTGRYIAYCDQDDVWRPAKLAAATDALDSTGAALFVHAASVIDDHGAVIGRFSQGIEHAAAHPPLTLGPWTVYYGFSMVFRATLHDAVPTSRRGPHPFSHNTLLSHDLWTYFLASSLDTVLTDPRPLTYYRRHSANETPSILARGPMAWLRKAGWSVDPANSRETIALHRAEILDDLATVADPAYRDRAVAAAEYWRKVADYERDRIEAYFGPRTSARVAALWDLTRTGAYRPVGQGGFGRKLLVKDVITGLFKES